LNCQIGDIVFEVVRDTQRLNLEGLQMQHCIYTYLNRICDRTYLAVNVTHLLSKERATAGFYRTGDKLEFDQLKGFYNSRATREVIEATIEFCKKNKISTRNSYDLSFDSGRTRPMPGQLSEKELAELRAKIAKEKEEEEKKNKNKKNAESDNKKSEEVKKNDRPLTEESIKKVDEIVEKDAPKKGGFFNRIFG
jgi:hypothetical protein